MKTAEGRNIRYFNISQTDEAWGIVVPTIGYQFIPPHTPYPPKVHPESYVFNPKQGRILKEYQLVYISKGSGYFESQSCKRQKIEAGTMLLLFPNEWHTYEPEEKSGWYEYWVGFRGVHIDKRVENGFFTPPKILFLILDSALLFWVYMKILYGTQPKRRQAINRLFPVLCYIFLVLFIIRIEMIFLITHLL